MLVKHADQPVIRTQYWDKERNIHLHAAYGVSHVHIRFCGKIASSLFALSSSGEKPKIVKAEAAAGTIVLWLAPSE